MSLLKQSTAANKMIFMADSTDHVTGKTGLTLTITASKDGAAFASISPTVTERGNGWYSLALTTSHTDTLGDLAVHVTGTGADPTDVLTSVVAGLPGEAVPDSSGVTTLLSRVVGTVAAGTHNPQSGDAYSRLGAPAGASVSADIAGVQSDTNDIQSRLPAALVGGKMDSVASVSGTMDANVVSIDGQLTSGNNATLNLKRITLAPAAGDNAILITMPSQSPGSGNRAPSAIKVTGAAVSGSNERGGHGLEIIGGAASVSLGQGGVGVHITGGEGTSNGGDGVTATGGATFGSAGNGINGVAGSGFGAVGINGVGSVQSVSGYVSGNVYGKVLGEMIVDSFVDGTVTANTVVIGDPGTLAADGSIIGCALLHFDGFDKLLQTRIVSGYDNTTFNVTVSENWTTTPQPGDFIRVAVPTVGAVGVSSAGVSAIWAHVIDGTRSAVQLIRGFAAALLGKSSGHAAGAPKYRNIGDTKNVIDATTDADGNRSTVTLDLD